MNCVHSVIWTLTPFTVAITIAPTKACQLRSDYRRQTGYSLGLPRPSAPCGSNSPPSSPFGMLRNAAALLSVPVIWMYCVESAQASRNRSTYSRCLDERDARERVLGDEPRSVTSGSAPGHLDLLAVAHGLLRWRRKETEILERVDVQRLTVGVLAVRTTVAVVVAAQRQLIAQTVTACGVSASERAGRTLPVQPP